MNTRVLFIFIVLLIKDYSNLYVNAIQKSELYPYGLSAGDTKLVPTNSAAKDEDISSDEIRLKTNIKFYSNEYGAIYVSIRKRIGEIYRYFGKILIYITMA